MMTTTVYGRQLDKTISLQNNIPLTGVSERAPFGKEGEAAWRDGDSAVPHAPFV